ncbi:MAG: transaldolase family protein [Solirubrobacteraceae bacterium]
MAPNVQVKVAATRGGLRAIEEVTAAGVSINATACFTVAQAIAIAEAVERGLARHEADGGDTSGMTPVCTIMVGRLADWMAVLGKRDGGHRRSRTRALGRRRRLQVRLRHLFRALPHASARRRLPAPPALIRADRGDVVLTIPCAWQRLFM